MDVHTNAVGFYISNASTYPLANLIVNGGGAGRQATLLTNCTANSLTITSGSILNDSTNVFTVTGNISNSGSVVDNTGGEIKLSGGASTHGLSGNGSYTNLELNDVTWCITFGNPTVTGTLTLTARHIHSRSEYINITKPDSWNTDESYGWIKFIARLQRQRIGTQYSEQCYCFE